MLKELVNKHLVTVEPDTKVKEAAKIMEKENVGTVLVLDNNRPRGILSDRDIVLRCIAKDVDVDDCTVENVMTESLATVNENDGIFDCIEKMRENHVRRIPVVNDQNKVVGILSFGDLLAILSKEFMHLTETTTAPEKERKMKAA